MHGVPPSFHAAMTVYFDILEVNNHAAAGLPHAFSVHYIESCILANSVMHVVRDLYIITLYKGLIDPKGGEGM